MDPAGLVEAAPEGLAEAVLAEAAPEDQVGPAAKEDNLGTAAVATKTPVDFPNGSSIPGA